MNNKTSSENTYLMLKKNAKKIIVAVLIIVMIIIPFDLKHQKQLEMVRQAYNHMNNGEYIEALEKFNAYYNGKTSIYWDIHDLVNGEDSMYGAENIEKAMSICDKII